MIYVLCKTYRDFDMWRKRTGLKNGVEARFIQDDRAIRGRRGQGDQFVRLHGWSTRPDARHLLATILAYGMTELRMEDDTIRRPMMVIEYMNRSRVQNTQFTVNIH